jgi:hypothetical protein
MQDTNGFKSLAAWHSMQNGLAVFYLVVVILNVGYGLYQLRVNKRIGEGIVWFLVAGLFALHMVLYASHHGPVLPFGFRDFTTNLMGAWGGQAGPILYSGVSVIAFVALLYYRKFLTTPPIAWAILNISLLAGGWSMTDVEFGKIITKEDNVPITILIFTVGYFTWLGLRKAVLNDDRLAKGEEPIEATENDKVLVWPDLVYTELIAMIAVTFLLVIWAVVLKAPLEQPATSAKAPNPSKAPWYFLGLQEMLVYFDPWMAGIVLPMTIMAGLIAIPYIDFNKKGNGYYTFNERPFAIVTFLVGFIVMWVTLIVLGTFLRGPNWNFFGPYEFWDTHKVLPLNNVNLSDQFWLNLMGRPLPANWVIREFPGIILVLLYLAAVPPLLARTVMRDFYIKMGFIRYMVLMNLLLLMASLPIKMMLRWAVNLKYIVYIPEYFFNI